MITPSADCDGSVGYDGAASVRSVVGGVVDDDAPQHYLADACNSGNAFPLLPLLETIFA
jgi:hypothetical protein